MNQKYMVIERKTAAKLEEAVNKFLDTGNWALQGGIAIGKDEYGTATYCQAFIQKIHMV